MSTLDMVFVGGVIAAMSSLMAAIGWACWYTRDKPAETPAGKAVEPEMDRRKAA